MLILPSGTTTIADGGNRCDDVNAAIFGTQHCSRVDNKCRSLNAQPIALSRYVGFADMNVLLFFRARAKTQGYGFYAPELGEGFVDGLSSIE